MHIGIDASRVAVSQRTGTERYSYELLAALAGLDRHNSYTLYCNGLPSQLPPLGPNFALRNIPASRLWTHLRLGPETLRHPPDVLFIPAHVLPLFHARNSVVTIHDLGYLAFPETHTVRRRLELHLTTFWSARAARRLITDSWATKHDLIERYRIAPDKISVIHLGRTAHFQPVVSDGQVIAAACARYGLDARYFLYVGTVQPRKNLARLIDAFGLAIRDQGLGMKDGVTQRQSSQANLKLVIAGKKGWLTESIERRAAELGIAEQVQFIGYVDDADLPALLSGALAFVFPSLYEGFGMPVLEAMACGAPVLTSTTSSLPEVAGDAALSVDPCDTQAIATALTRLANEPNLREDLRVRGLKHVGRFSWERCAEQTLSVLSSVV
ncbi:MAG: glycosyltransferase family 4 protein [Chloroflexales bacterium]|nr:glycosyltransferase family 4 protein [Chloroflexales bacterium]